MGLDLYGNYKTLKPFSFPETCISRSIFSLIFDNYLLITTIKYNTNIRLLLKCI